jgi:HK97 family phage portal protein
VSTEDRALSDIVWTPERGLSDPEIRGISWNNFLLSGENYGGRWRTDAEVRVTPETALQSTVVLACCRILAETISSLPLHVYRRGEGGSKDIARDIPLHRVLSFAPNAWQTKFEFFEQMVMNLCLWGNSYTQIKSGRYGAVSELINLHPSRMEVERLENGRLRYMYTNPETGRLEPSTQDQIMHVRWTPEPDGIKGMVPVEVAREAIALARACEIHAAKFWANSARPGMVLQTDASLSPEAAERLRDNWERLHRGVDRAYKTAILTNGLKVEPVGFTAEQSQFESTRRFQSEEIARVYRLPLRLVQGQSGGNPEIEGQDFVTYTLVPWLRRIESAISRSLIYNDDLFVAEFDVRGLMRGDSNSRAGYYSTMTNLGIFSINDCRRLENMAPLENGDKHFVGMNMQTLEDAVKPKPDPMMDPAPGGPPPPAQGGVPSLPEVKTGKSPNPAEHGEQSKPKEEGVLVSYGDGKTGRVKHVMEKGTLDLKSGEKIEVQPGEPVALVVDEETGEEAGIKVSQLKPIQEKRALSPQNQALYDAQEEIVKKSGRWPQQGPSGAHYMEKNPFASRGIACRNCIYYEEGGSCEVVKGIISPNAICKLWIIPEEKLSMPESRDCGTGAGASESDDPVRGFRRGEGDKKQTRVAKKLYQMGTSERRIKDLVRQLGGKPGRSSAKVAGDKIGISVRDSSGKDIFYVEMGYSGAGIVPVGKTLSKDQASKIESLAKPAFPEKISDRLYNRGKEYPVSAHRDDSSLKTGGRIAKKGKQQRAFCPTGVGGGIDNSCGAGEKLAPDTGGGTGGGSGKESSSAKSDRIADMAIKSLEKTKGFSIHPVSESSPTSGYMVSVVPESETIVPSGQKVTGQVISKFLDENKSKFADRPALHIGGWYNAEEDAVYLDLSEPFDDINDAIDSAESTSQLAIWDLNEKKEIRKDEYDGRRTRPKRETRAVRLPVGGEGGRDRGGDRGDEGEGQGRAGSQAAEDLAAELRESGEVDVPSVVFRPAAECRAIAEYDLDTDSIYVSESLNHEAVASFRLASARGWLSQPNPLLHELAHRHHALADEESYEASSALSFGDEGRKVAESVSRYAATSHREFVAETLAGLWSGKDYGDDVMRLLSAVTNGKFST